VDNGLAGGFWPEMARGKKTATTGKINLAHWLETGKSANSAKAYELILEGCAMSENSNKMPLRPSFKKKGRVFFAEFLSDNKP
jgi:hypothetical protein